MKHELMNTIRIVTSITAAPYELPHDPTTKKFTLDIPANATSDQLAEIADETARRALSMAHAALTHDDCEADIEISSFKGNKYTAVFHKKVPDFPSFQLQVVCGKLQSVIRAAIFVHLTDPARGV